MIKNSQPFGENVRKPQGGCLTHTVYKLSNCCRQRVSSFRFPLKFRHLLLTASTESNIKR